MAIPFAMEARREFDVVAREYGLSFVLADEREVCYESDRAILRINFDNGRSYELGVEFGRKSAAQLEPRFSLGEVLRASNVAEAASVDGLMTSDPARLRDALKRLSELTSRHAADLLTGSDDSFARVAAQRRREVDAYAIEGALRTARARSEAAWATRNYLDVVNALESVEQFLSPAEKKRLEYSRRHLAP